MDSDNKKIKFKKIFLILIFVPILIFGVIIFSRIMVTPSNEEIIDELHKTKNYSCEVEYTFINSKNEYKESTVQYYSVENGMRIEFQDANGRAKIYKGSEIQMQGENGKSYIIDKNIDEIYPLAFINNILDDNLSGEIESINTEWSDNEYIRVSIDYPDSNKHIDKGEFYVDKKTKSPVMLKIFDDEGKERILISYKDFKISKDCDESLF